ncbi:insulinase family protein, partial [Candidatus Woesearchaeota archaeon]|nr:insulinase family protein [Candidatus Woesearchaeota archaeon]
DVLDVIHSILGRGQSGKMFIEIRSTKGLAYDVGTQNVIDTSFGYFAIYATIDKKNIINVKNIILAEMQKLKNTTAQELKEAKDYIEGNYLLEIEDNQKVADQLLFWDHVQSVDLMNMFLKNVKNVSLSDIRRVVKKYFNKYTMTVLEGK